VPPLSAVPAPVVVPVSLAVSMGEAPVLAG
jgi:hypothetical protein